MLVESSQSDLVVAEKPRMDHSDVKGTSTSKVTRLLHKLSQTKLLVSRESNNKLICICTQEQE